MKRLSMNIAKRALTLVLTIALIASLIPPSAVANINMTKHNTPEHNQDILTALQALYGDGVTAQQALEELERLGVIDGDEWVTATIDVDGEQLTLAQLRHLAFDPNADLTQVMHVDGLPITLGDLKVMIEIEDEIQRIKDTYFSDVVLNAEQQESLASLQEQIYTQGITIYSDSTQTLVFPSGVNHNIYAVVEPSKRLVSGAGLDSVSVTLWNSNGPLATTPNYDINIPYRFIDASAKMGTHYTPDNGYLHTLTFPANSPETTQHIPFTIMDDYARWEGEKVFLIQYYNPEKVVFGQNGLYAAETVVTIESTFVWDIIEGPFLVEPLRTRSLGGLNPQDDFKVESPHMYSNMFHENLIDKVKFEIAFTGHTGVNNFGSYSDYMGIQVMFGHQDSDERLTVPFPSYPEPQAGVYTEYVCYHNFYSAMLRGMHAARNESYNLRVMFLNVYGLWDREYTLSFVDTIVPTINSVTVPPLPEGVKYEFSQSVPIVVEYSEPVNLTDVTLRARNINPPVGLDIRPIEENSRGTRTATFLYKVQTEDSNLLLVSHIQGAKDLQGNVQVPYAADADDDTPLEFTDIIRGIRKDTVFTTATANANLTDGVVQVEVRMGLDDIPQWLAYEAANNDGLVPSIYASIDGGQTKIDLNVLEENGEAYLVGKFVDDFNTGSGTETRVVEFYLDREPNSSDNHTLLIGTYATYDVEHVVFLEEGDFSITYHNFPNDGVVFVEDDIPLHLGITIDPSVQATWQDPIEDFEWISSNPAVATVTSNGTIILEGATGIVTFSLKAKNGDVQGKSVTYVGDRALDVRVGMTPFLNIPQAANVVNTRQGDGAEVRWITNLFAKNAELAQDTSVNIKVFDLESNPTEPVYSNTITGNVENPITRYTIPGSVLTRVGHRVYRVEVSSLDPINNVLLTATAYITVFPQPTIVRLQPLTSYYITDSTPNVPINWTLQHFDIVYDAEFELEIRDNKDGRIVAAVTETANDGGSYLLSIPPVSEGLKDIYTVTVKAKNATDSTWSYDSFVLQVYNDAALKIWIDGGVTVGHEHTMSNLATFSTMSSAEILALQRHIYLTNTLSINHGDYAWGQIGDMISWRSIDSTVASINFLQGSLYDNIENFYYTSYRPGTEFILAGLQDGSTQVKATHARTGMQQTLTVNVETLKDKLYLFQVFPRTVTTLNYTNGNGQVRSVDTDETGALALYEENGIASSIYMQSTFDGKQYRGTLYPERLVSAERDATRLQLYPENTFRLREVATVQLYFKQPDGTPYQGEVTLRGGVYKNGKYCPDALINDLPGTADQTINVGSDGKFTAIMDASQFWTESYDEGLRPQDRFQFIYEVRFLNDQYYPQLLTINGNLNTDDLVRFGLSTINLRTVAHGQGNKPFIDSQFLRSTSNMPDFDIHTFAGSIGPNQNRETVTAVTTYLWWGESLDLGHHNLYFQDQYGIVPRGQHHQVVVYPFSTMKASIHSFTLDRSVMEGWIEPFADRGLELVVIGGNGNQYQKLPMTYRVVNMLDAQRVEQGDNLQFMLETLTSASTATITDIHISDSFISRGLSRFSQQGIEHEMFNMVVRPTEDPRVFRAFIQAGISKMAYQDEDPKNEFEYKPGITDLQGMSEGTYFVKQRSDLKDNMSKSKHSDHAWNYTLGGYMEAEIIFNPSTKEWEVFVLHGGFNAGGGVSFKWNINFWVGPLPVTIQYGIGATMEVIFKGAIQRGEDIYVTFDKRAVNDYLTTLRFHAYIRAFGGLGIDYSVVALKIGLFGQVYYDAQYAFLNQPYLASLEDPEQPPKRQGQLYTVGGRVGGEAVAKFLFVSFRHVFGSIPFNITKRAYGQWNQIQDIWKEIIKGFDEGSGIGGMSLEQPLMLEDGQILYPLLESAIIEDRTYLERFERTWATPSGFGMMALDPDNKVAALETNAYPYANPVLTDDGHILVYISDADSSAVENTEVRWTQRVHGSYPNGVAIDPAGGGCGDSQLKLAGTKDFAAAVWVRQTEGLKKEAGEPVTNTDIALMTNSTEVMVSVFDGTCWQTTQLTDNATPDLSPVIATNGDKLFVAWRSVYAADSDDPLTFSGIDSILYSIYEQGQWTEPATLYNGTSGAVKGLNTAMLANGTVAVIYAIDTLGEEVVLQDEGEQGIDSGMEIIYAIVDQNGQVSRNVRLTNDRYVDQNPQITTITFDDHQEWFILGWHSIHDADGVSVNDIRLRAINTEGALHSDFIDSLSSIGVAGNVLIGDNFTFAKNATTLNDLSIIWSEAADTKEHISEEADKDVLKAVRFRSDNGRINLSAPLEVAMMPNYTLIDHFDVYTVDEGTVKAVILGTSYDNGFEPTGWLVQDGGQWNELVLPIRQSHLYTATATYENQVELQLMLVDYESVIRGMRIPVQFRLCNAGFEPINSLTIQIGDNIVVYDNLNFLPNDSILFTASYDVPQDRVINPPYMITATFSSEYADPQYVGPQQVSVHDIVEIQGTLHLDIPDVGISRLDNISEENGQRVMQVTLYNYSDAQLADSGRVVKLGFFSDVDYSVEAMPTIVVDNDADLAMIDVGTFTQQVVFDIIGHVGEGNEIPLGGVRLYVRAWIEAPLPDESGETGEIVEYWLGNNMASILFESLILRNDGQLATIATEQINEGGITQAHVTVKNNSLVRVSSGNLIVRLHDNNGNVLEELQSYDPQASNQGLIELGAEETATRTFAFSQQGTSVTVSYSNAILEDNTNTNLTSLTLSQIPFRYEAGVRSYTVNVNDMTSTMVSAVTQDPNATVTINDTEGSSARVNLVDGRNLIRVHVTAADRETTATYEITVYNHRPDPQPPGTWQPVITHNQGGTVTVSADNRHVTITPDEGYRVKDVKVNGASVGAVTSYSTPTWQLVYRVEVVFEEVVKRITIIHNPGGVVTICEDEVELTITPDEGYRIEDVLVDEASIGPVSSYTFADTTTIHVVEVVFARVDDTPPSITIVHNTGGTAVLSDDERCILALPDEGYLVLNMRVNGVFLGAVTRYCMEPGMDYEVEVVFVEMETVVAHLVDVSPTHWARKVIAFVVNRGLLIGTSGTEFSPNIPITRAMLVSVLSRVDGAQPQTPAQFKDVSPDAWYAKTVAWAVENGIAHPYAQGYFEPNRPVTREELTVMLLNYFKFIGIELPTYEVEPFADSANISEWAKEAVLAIQQAKIMVGKPGHLFDPHGTLTRAEFSAVLQRVIINYLEE